MEPITHMFSSFETHEGKTDTLSKTVTFEDPPTIWDVSKAFVEYLRSCGYQLESITVNTRYSNETVGEL